MKKYILILLITCLCFISIDNANAEVFTDINFKINGSTLTTTNTVWTPQGNVTLSFYSDKVFSFKGEIPEYGYVTLCAAIKTSYPTWNSTGSYHFDDIIVTPTSQPCTLYDSPGYNPTLVYITFKTWNAFNCSSSGTSCYLDSPFIQFYSSSNNVWTLKNFAFTDTPYEFDNSSSTIIDQNQTQIEQNQTQIQQNQTQIDQNNQIIQGQGQIKDSITSEDGPTKLDALQNSAGWLPAGPVDSILNLPLSLLNNLSTNLGKSCQPVILPLPFGVGNITLPCLNTIYSQIDGLSTWINTISIVAAAFILYSYLLKLYAWVDGVITMRENTWNDADQWGGL